jgi:hypothetical protein
MEFQYRYDREEGNTMFDADSSSFFLGDNASFQKKEAELAKRLVCLKCLNTFSIFLSLCGNFFFFSKHECQLFEAVDHIIYNVCDGCKMFVNF